MPRCFQTLRQAQILNIPDIHLVKPGFRILLEVDVDGEVGIHVAHLVFETLGDANYQVVNDGFDSPKCGNVLPCAVM